MREFKREPQEGGHTYVTHPNHPGFMFMLRPGEDDVEMTKAFDTFVLVEQTLATVRPELDRLRAENERLRRLPTEEEIAEALFMRGSKDRFGKFASLNHDAKELWLGDARAVLALIEESRR